MVPGRNLLEKNNRIVAEKSGRNSPVAGIGLNTQRVVAALDASPTVLAPVTAGKNIRLGMTGTKQGKEEWQGGGENVRAPRVPHEPVIGAVGVCAVPADCS
jgi:hypothetical protein